MMEKAIFNWFLLAFIPVALLQGQSFQKKTAASGLAAVSHTNGLAVADYDLDGDLDVVFIGAERYHPDSSFTGNRFYRNNGEGTFSDYTEQSGIQSMPTPQRTTMMGYKFGASWGDFDNDGYPDLYITNATAPNQLYRNRGDGTFEDVTQLAGVQGNETDEHSSAVWWDYDLDGDLDLYVGAWLGRNILYENQGNGTFADVSEASGLDDSGQTWVSLPIDADNDGRFDLYVINDFGANRFYRNNGNADGVGFTYIEETVKFGLKDEGDGMGVAVGDYNNDGFFDIYLTNISDWFPNPLFKNNGNGTFENTAAAVGVDIAGWGWGTVFFDCEHDGDEDLYVVAGMEHYPNQNFFFLNQRETGRTGFVDMSEESQTNGLAPSRSVDAFDYDNDGDLDLLVGNANEAPYLYENQSFAKNWLQITLEGTISNRSAYGSVVRVKAGPGTYYRYHIGVGFLAQNQQPLHFGLNTARTVDEILVRWPNGKEERIEEDIKVNQRITIKEGEGLIAGQLAVGDVNNPESFVLYGNFPNPFNGSTLIEFGMPGQGIVALQVFDPSGQRIMRLQKAFSTAGRQQIAWNGVDENGANVSSGLYFYWITFQNITRAGKMIYLK